MNIIIVGGGNVGLSLAQHLRSENHDISIIDPHSAVLEYAETEYDVMGVEGSGACYEDLLAAGADKAELLIATSTLDELNILSCVMAKRMGTHRCIARVRDPKLSNHSP